MLGFVYGSEGVTFDCKKGSLVIVGYFPLIQLHVSTQSQSVFIRHACDSIASEIQSSYSAVGQTLLEQRVGFLNAL